MAQAPTSRDRGGRECWRRDGWFAPYGFIACDEGQTDAARVGERHASKGDKEAWFGEVLNCPDLHHPHCSVRITNQLYHLTAGWPMTSRSRSSGRT